MQNLNFFFLSSFYAFHFFFQAVEKQKQTSFPLAKPTKTLRILEIL